MEKNIEESMKTNARLLVEVIKSGRIEELRGSPKKVIEDVLGYSVPDAREITVLQETLHQGYIVIPYLPEDSNSLSDEELYNAIMAGTCKNTGTIEVEE